MSGIVGENGESSTYLTISKYIDGIKKIINSSGLFINNYDGLCAQFDCINMMIDQYNDATTPSLKKDLYDDFIEKTDWKKLSERLTSDIKNKKQGEINKLKPFKFKYPKLETLSMDTINNMNMCLSDVVDLLKNGEKIEVQNLTQKQKKHILQYSEYKNDFEAELDIFKKSIQDYEKRAVQSRTANETILKENIETLYNVHLKYAYYILNKKQPEFTEIAYKDDKGNIKTIPLDKSQNKFIKNAIKIMLDI